MAILEASNKQDLEGKEMQALEEARSTAPPRNKGLRREREVSSPARGGKGLESQFITVNLCEFSSKCEQV